MRLTTAIAILSLVSTAESLSTGGENHRRSRQQRGSTSPLPYAAAKSSARASSPRPEVDSDIFGQAVENDNGKRNPRKKGVTRPPRPPLVDSALLRFLSKQKRLREQNGNDAGTSPTATNKDGSDSQVVGTSYSLLSAMDQGRESTGIGQTKQLNARTTRSTQQLDGADSSQSSLEQNNSELPLKADDSLDSWMGQFNRNRAAKVLMALGSVDELLANQAGECVQRYALARMARRRVREFLKERDTMWEEGRAGPSIVENKLTAAITAQPEYGFSDVVDVMIEKGLTAKDVATILTHTPSIALMMPKRPEGTDGHALGGETVEETLQRSLSDLLCTTLKLRKYDARKVLRNSPGLLTKRGSISANQVVAAMAKLGVSTSSIARDKAGLPTLLSRPPAALFRLIAFLGSDAIRMPINKIGPLIRRSVCLDLLDAVAPVARYQQDQKATTDLSPHDVSEGTEAGILPAFVGRTIEQRKKLIDDTYGRMSVTAWTLRNRVGTSDLGKVIAAYPNVLLLDASKQVLPVAEYLMEDLGIWEDDLARVLQLYPSLLGVPVAQMERVVDFIVAQGVAEENLASIFRSFPALLTLDIEKDMVPVIQFLRSIGIKNVGRFISRLPPILGYSVEQEMIPKWEFIRDIYTYPSFEASKFPAFFSYPMERIKARFEYLSDVKLLPISLIAPDLVLRYGDRDFSMKVAGDNDEGAAFARFLEERQDRLPGKRRGRTRRKKAP